MFLIVDFHRCDKKFVIIDFNRLNWLINRQISSTIEYYRLIDYIFDDRFLSISYVLIIPKIILKLKIKLKLRKTRYTLDPKLVVREYSTPNFKLKNTVHLKLNTPICCIPWAKPWPTLIDVSWPKLMNYDNHETTTKDFLKSQLSIAIDF